MMILALVFVDSFIEERRTQTGTLLTNTLLTQYSQAIVRNSLVGVLGSVPAMTPLQSNNCQREHIVLKSLRQTLHEEIV